METEEDIVYSIIETVKKGNLTDDSRMNERLIRGFLKIYRASAIAKSSNIGVTITDECFQYLGNLRFDYVKSKQFARELPKIIKLHTFGIQVEAEGENIPVLNSEEYNLSLKSLLNGKLPKAKMTANKLTVYTGEYLIVDGRRKPKQSLLIDNLLAQASVNANAFIEVEVHAILDNPDDAPGYDWTIDSYPCPSELIEEIKTKILSKEFNLILNIKTDKVTDSDDNDSYQGQQQRMRNQQE